MPTASFPRDLRPSDVSLPTMGGGLLQRTDTGKVQVRSKPSAGRVWTETWPPLLRGTGKAEKLLAWIEWAWATSQVFTIQHYRLPGSGIPAVGAGGGFPVVSSCNGDVLTTGGWTPNVTKVVAAGDVIKVAGMNTVLRVLDDANSNGSGAASFGISPTILQGSEPGGGSSITRDGVLFRAIIGSAPNMPSGPPGSFLEGLSLTFWEMV